MKKVTIVWSVFENEGYWYYMFGNKESKPTTSRKIMTKMMAEKELEREMGKLKMQYGNDCEITTEELKI